MKQILMVAAGGAAGVTCRYLISLLLPLSGIRSHLWSATLLVNLIGCFLIGWAVQWMESKEMLESGLYLLLVTGFLGGFTTYSSFGLEGLTLLKSSSTLFFLYITLHFVGGFLLVWAGYRAGMAVTA
ncbi:MAG: CrcB family protein [Balneolaceae bacterium]